MTYTIEVLTSKPINWDIVHKADETIHSGMLEKVLPDLISFHDLDDEDVPKAIEFLNAEGFTEVKSIYLEDYEGCYCHLSFLYEVKGVEAR